MSTFTVIHVCMGNICRSPMSERLLVRALRAHVGARVGELYRNHGAGVGDWHVGDPMQPHAAAEVRHRGGDPSGFAARYLTAELVDESDLVLCASAEHAARAVQLRPGARGRVFVLGEFGRLLRRVPAVVAPTPTDPAAAHARGVALVAAVDAVRAGARPRLADNLDDPYGRSRRAFARCADTIDATVIPLAAALAA